MKWLAILGSIILVAVVFIGAVANQQRPPSDPVMVELCLHVGTEWMKGQLASVAVNDAQASDAILTIKYGSNIFERIQAPAHQRQLIRALLAEIKARDLKLPRFVWIYATFDRLGESGTWHTAHLETAKWDSSSDAVKFEKYGN